MGFNNTDFEKALVKAIDLEIKNKYDTINHYGFFFHYLKNIRKKLVNLGFGTDANKSIYDEVLDFCYELPFIENIEKNIKNKINQFFKKKSNLIDFKDYFLEEWAKYFSQGNLNLRKVKKKFLELIIVLKIIIDYSKN